MNSSRKDLKNQYLRRNGLFRNLYSVVTKAKAISKTFNARLELLTPQSSSTFFKNNFNLTTEKILLAFCQLL